MLGIDLNIFFNKPERSLDLYEKLNEKVYLKSQIDVVYTDYINWERSGILLTNSDKEKGTQNKISRKDYLWCKLIEQLRRFNVSINDISILKSEWIDVNYFPEILKILIPQLGHGFVSFLMSSALCTLLGSHVCSSVFECPIIS